MNRQNLLVSLLLMSHGLIETNSDLLKKAGESLRKSTESIFVEVTQEKRLLRQSLEQEKKVFEQQQQDSQQTDRAELEDLDTAIATTKVALSQAEHNELLAKKLTTLNELYQTLKDQYAVRHQIIAILDEHCNLLASYLDDPDFSKFKKDHKFKEYLIYYSFNDVQYLYKMIFLQEQRIAQLFDHDKNAHTELNHRKQSVVATALAYKQKQEEREKTVKQSVSETDTQHLIDLLNLEEQLYKHKQKLDELRLKEIERKVQLLETKKFIVEEQLKILKSELRRIKPSVKITEADLTVARESLNKQQQEHIRLAEVNRKRLNIILAERQEKEKTLVAMSKRFSVPLNSDVDTWKIQPQDTLSSYVGICQVGALNSYLLLLDTKRMHIDLLGMVDDFKLSNEQLQLRVKESFYKIGARKFGSQEAILKEMQRYEAPKADARANLSLYRAKMNEVDEWYKQQREIIDGITTLRQNIGNQQAKLFRNAAKEYFACLEVLSHAELAVKERIDMFKRINSTYAAIVSEIEKTLRHISFIVTELNSITIWHRPDYAISWQGIKQMLPDFEFFFFDLCNDFKPVETLSMINTVHSMVQHPYAAVLCIVLLLLCLAMMIGAARYGATGAQYLMVGTHATSELVVFLTHWCVALVLFIHAMAYLIGIWLTIALILYCYQQYISNYIYAWFYLLSIPYLLVIATYLRRHLIEYNLSRGYTLLSMEFQRRFVLVTTAVLNGEIIFGLLYCAFMAWVHASHYVTSELPALLLALCAIIFQVGLILLISKKRLLSVIPEQNEIWRFVRTQVGRYYPVLLFSLIALIILGNPYIGFGRLMIYLIRSLSYTVLLMVAILWLYGWLKNALSRAFFIRDGDTVREKFEHAKSWFGILVIALFICFSLIACIVIARIWGSSLTWHQMSLWLHKPLIPDLKPPITTWSLLYLVMFVMGGFLVSYGLDHFVLDKIFDLLLVDMGVQYTITSITRYLIVIAAIFLGFQQVGLGSLIVYIVGVLALGIGWILKEPISDFVAYFIILVQRPVKIGDYIQIDDTTMGVVRRISPRALVLRRRNSTTIVVPNSYLVNRTITNWNYVRKYIAFDDINLIVHFTEDPEQVRQLLYEATQSHTKVLKNPAPIVRLDNFGEYGYVFLIRGFISDVYTLDQWDIASEVRLSIVKKLRDHNISIAVPVWVQTHQKERSATHQSVADKRIPEGGNINE